MQPGEDKTIPPVILCQTCTVQILFLLTERVILLSTHVRKSQVILAVVAHTEAYFVAMVSHPFRFGKVMLFFRPKKCIISSAGMSPHLLFILFIK